VHVLNVLNGYAWPMGTILAEVTLMSVLGRAGPTIGGLPIRLMPVRIQPDLHASYGRNHQHHRDPD